MFKKTAIMSAVSATLALTQTPMTLAQESGFMIEEVVVSARKRSENLQDVPMAINAIDATTMERAGVERAGDYISLIPNVTLVDTANVGDTQVSIRGIVSTRDAESTFAYVVDGVLSTNPNSFNEELFDVQQIEEMGMELAQNVKDYVVNVDITNIQFDAVQMYEEARKLGLDAGDLSEYGFEEKGKCTNLSCINRDKVKSWSDYFDNMGNFQSRIADKSQQIINQAKCHPKFRDSPLV